MEDSQPILRKTVRRALAIVAGIVLIAVSIVGFILPMLPGWPFLAAGIVLLCPKSRFARWVLRLPARIKARFRKTEEPPGAGRQAMMPDDQGGRGPDESVESSVHKTGRP